MNRPMSLRATVRMLRDLRILPRLDARSQRADAVALDLLRPLLEELPYLPWSTSALRPAALQLICNDIVLNDRRSIIEFGGGISTLVLSRLAADQAKGAHITTVEHDEAWAEKLQELLAAAGLEQTCKVVHAPLDEKWYVWDSVERHLGDRCLDLVVVDGPPAYRPTPDDKQHPRSHALGAVREHLAESFSIYLDDIDRPGEYETLHRWAAELGVTPVVEITRGSIGRIIVDEQALNL